MNLMTQKMLLKYPHLFTSQITLATSLWNSSTAFTNTIFHFIMVTLARTIPAKMGRLFDIHSMKWKLKSLARHISIVKNALTVLEDRKNFKCVAIINSTLKHYLLGAELKTLVALKIIKSRTCKRWVKELVKFLKRKLGLNTGTSKRLTGLFKS